MEKTFSIPVKGISINVIIGQWCHRMLQKDLREQPADSVMNWAIKHASARLIHYGYSDYCGRNGMPTLFSYEEIKEMIDAVQEGDPDHKLLQELGLFYRMVQDEYD